MSAMFPQGRDQNGALLLFPSPYPGECYYSLLARYHERSVNYSARYTSLQLFGTAVNLRACVTLPYRIMLADSWLSSGCGLTVQALMFHHTAWQYLQVSDLFPEESLEPIMKAEPKPGRRKQSRMIMALQGSKRGLCYCPACVAYDTQQYQEPYWHLVHQLHGVRYCPIHRVRILESDRTSKSLISRYYLASDASLIPTLDADHGENDPYVEEYYQLGTTIHWLVSHGLEVGSGKALVEWYREHGLQPEKSEILSLLSSRFDKLFLEQVLGGDGYDWLMAGAQNHDISMQPPIVHALVMTALSGSAQNIYQQYL